MPIVIIKMWSGRSHEQKKELAEAITADMVRILGKKAETIQIVFEDTDKTNWAVAGILPEP
jgi:4-oxalocrotonate tautomerase